MLRISCMLFILLVSTSCVIGPSIKKLPQTRTGQGIIVALTTEMAPGNVTLYAEVLAVEAEGLLLCGTASPQNVQAIRLVRIAYGAIEKATFEGHRGLNFGKGRIPSAEQRETLRLLSRFPQGVNEDLMPQLLAAYDQDELLTIQ